ncbi:MAG: hypothetical protein PVF19_05475 [Gemmatimonadota bacterium]|jgi:hypothetical protein
MRIRFGAAVASAAAAILVATASPSPSAGQSVAMRSPNVMGGWSVDPGVIQLNFVHRFSMGDAPARKITTTPTFNVATGVTGRFLVGFVYGTNSTLVAAYPNEWEPYARARLLTEAGGAPADVSVQVGYNFASESIDGELLVARSLGRLRLLVVGRAFSDAYEGSRARFAATGGALLRLTTSISVAGDYGFLLDRKSDEPTAWSAGVQLGVPRTPHSLSVHVSNVGTASLEGSSRGTRTRFGIEYTIPITLRRLR